MPQDFSSYTLLQVIPKLIGGGAERTTLEVAQAFREAGGRSLVVSSGGDMALELVGKGSEHIEMPVDSKNPWLISQNARDLSEVIEREGVSLVHARSRAPAWSCLMAAKRTGRPFVTTFHGAYSARSRLKKLYNSVMVRGDAVIANSRYTAESIRKQFAGRPYFSEARLVTIPRGADLSRFGPNAVAEEAVASQRQLLGSGLRVVLPGRFTGWKGQRVLIEAARRLSTERPELDISFTAIGRMDEKPDYLDELRRSISSGNLDARFRLLPATENVPALMLAADVVVSASTEPEAFGRVAVEAQASGVPIIATAHGGSLETVIDGETGFLVPPGDAEGLAKAILKVNDLGQAGRDAMGARGMAHARAHYTTKAMTSATLAVYDNVLRGQGADR